jgi:class 3 adenylate cyclase
MAGAEAEKSFRTESDSAQHDVKQQKQVDILLQFLQSSRDYCVCVVDIVNSTQVTMSLPHEKIGKYYGLFLNTMAEIATKHGAVVVKNVGDSLLYYFPKTDSGSAESFESVIQCSSAMIDARTALNDAMHREGFPDINYRISCEYGQVAVAKVSTSSVDDIFGTAVNISSKINRFAPQNGIVIGSGFYERVKAVKACEFSRLENPQGLNMAYPVYLVKISR